MLLLENLSSPMKNITSMTLYFVQTTSKNMFAWKYYSTIFQCYKTILTVISLPGEGRGIHRLLPTNDMKFLDEYFDHFFPIFFFFFLILIFRFPDCLITNRKFERCARLIEITQIGCPFCDLRNGSSGRNNPWVVSPR